MNWFAIMIIGVWMFSAIAAAVTKDGLVMICPMIFSILAGFGYFLMRAP